MSIQPISFGATTKNGNHYKKTHVGTIMAAVAGASIACDLKNIRKVKVPKTMLKPIVENMQKLVNNGFAKPVAKKITINSLRTGIVGGIVSVGLILFGVGAGINKIANAIKAKKADNAAKQV